MPHIKTRIRNSTPETRRQRLLVWRMFMEILRGTHRGVFPGRKLGQDMYSMLVLGAAIATHLEGRPVTASKIAHYMEMPRETVRRTLNVLVKRGYLDRVDNHYEPTEKVGTAHIESVAERAKRLAALL